MVREFKNGRGREEIKEKTKNPGMVTEKLGDLSHRGKIYMLPFSSNYYCDNFA